MRTAKQADDAVYIAPIDLYHCAAILLFFYSTQCNQTEAGRKIQSGSFHGVRIELPLSYAGYLTQVTTA